MQTNTIASRPLWLRTILATPFIGWILRDLMFGDKNNIWYLLGALACLWAVAILTWGVPALYLPAVAAVPVIMLILILITRG
ncbi:hypothetical protein C8N32_1129 [Rhodovulum imhoffii]|uniref:Uncharacterized protein n=1 Tax=Rhodovulum imhoffii TaxID=365340 RepID=A0A2T5BQM9_9RHOB|nr:hypothetical protein [Rhodovulum imhoffii]MBK5933912.1 hypothetical protein [Rhodovulum imhoffii]PTN01500.1 hypothetical protein C8N32_1129 [Rhodovulum imhoffii]